MALSVSVPVMSSTPKGQVPRLRTAAERERDDVVYLQPIAGAAAPPAVPVDIAATTLVAPPHLPPHGSGDVPGPGARRRAEAAQRGEVPLQRWRMLHRPHRAVPGCVRKPLRRRSRKPAAAPRRCPRRVASAGFRTAVRPRKSHGPGHRPPARPGHRRRRALAASPAKQPDRRCHASPSVARTSARSHDGVPAPKRQRHKGAPFPQSARTARLASAPNRSGG